MQDPEIMKEVKEECDLDVTGVYRYIYHVCGWCRVIALYPGLNSHGFVERTYIARL